MDHFHIRTSGGVFGFVGQVHRDRARPALLAVNGSFPDRDYLHDLVDRFAGAHVLIAYLPGMGPPWAEASVADMTAGLAEAVVGFVGDAPLVVYGASTGNLLALGLQLPSITAKISTEPFFHTKDLAPFIAFARRFMAQNPGEAGRIGYLRSLFGIHPDGRLEDRDYTGLLQGITVPTQVLVGAEASDSWGGDGTPWPSLTSAEDRARLAAHPLVTLHVGDPGSGHAVGVSGSGKALVERWMHRALLDASKRCV